MSGRKPRSDAKLRSLPPDQKTLLSDWLVDENVPYDVAVKRIKQHFGIKTSRGAVQDFYQKECFNLRFRKARNDAETIKDMLREDPETFDEATIAAISQKAFELAVAKDSDPKQLVALAKIMGDTARLRLQEKRLNLDLVKFRTTVKSDIEKGLDALYQEISENPEALALFERLKAVVLESVGGAAA